MDFVGYVPKQKVSDEGFWNLSQISRQYARAWFMQMTDLGDPMSIQAPLKRVARLDAYTRAFRSDIERY